MATDPTEESIEEARRAQAAERQRVYEATGVRILSMPPGTAMRELVTTDATIGRDLRATLNRQRGVPCGLTWGDFKAAMALLGVRDDDRLASIDYGCGTGTGRLVRDDATDGIEVRETRS